MNWSWGSAAVAASVASVVACSPTALAPSQPAGSGPVGVLVVPASNHVTGLPYPAHCTARGKLPDPVCTPGSIRSDVDPTHLELTVCKPGWAGSVLPPSGEFGRAKTAAMLAYGVPETQREVTEYDHRIPRSIGGSNDRTNLWVEVSDQPGKGVHNSKDDVELRVHLAVCRGAVKWRDAVVAFAGDWTTAESTLHLTR